GATSNYPVSHHLCRVSIHAPARGATFAQEKFNAASRFQSTRPRGARRAVFFQWNGGAGFQSTRPRGARRGSHVGRERRECFNPRARAGRDSAVMWEEKGGSVSIHAPARGATFVLENTGPFVVFQSTRPRGARQFQCRRPAPLR